MAAAAVKAPEAATLLATGALSMAVSTLITAMGTEPVLSFIKAYYLHLDLMHLPHLLCLATKLPPPQLPLLFRLLANPTALLVKTAVVVMVAEGTVVAM
jgi:hypothetical protein